MESRDTRFCLFSRLDELRANDTERCDADFALRLWRGLAIVWRSEWVVAKALNVSEDNNYRKWFGRYLRVSDMKRP